MQRIARKGRPPKRLTDEQWQALNELILQGMTRLPEAALALSLSPATLHKNCERRWGLTFGAYCRKIRAEAQLPGQPFSPIELKSVLESYYAFSFSKTDHAARLQKVRAIQYRLSYSPSTGENLFALLTYPQLDAVVAEMRRLPLSLNGVAVRDGLEYALRVWVDPLKQACTLPELLGHDLRRCLAEERAVWKLTPLGKQALKEALIAFHRVMMRTLYPRKEAPHEQEHG